MTWQPPTDDDLSRLREQLGRPVRGVHAIAARCACGAPAVVVTEPRLDDGTPFPTVYYLSLPSAVRAASRLEATGAMARYQQRLGEDKEALARYAAGHREYIHTRNTLGVVDEVHNVSAGGMPDRVKCLHALVAHSLAEGPGRNPVGDWALEESAWNLGTCECDRD